MPAPHALPARGRVGVVLPRNLPAHDVLSYVRLSEELGFDQIWVVEDLGWRGGIAQAASVLVATNHITVGIGIMPADARNVCYTAMEVASLAELYPGRLIAGIGYCLPHWMREGASWPSTIHPMLIKEYAAALRLLLAGEPGPANGRYVHCEGAVLTRTPAIVPPVALCVGGPRPKEGAREITGGLLLAEPSAPAYVTAFLHPMGPAATASAPEIVTFDVATVDDSEDAALARVRADLQTIGTPDWAVHFDLFPFATEPHAHRTASPDARRFAQTMPAARVRELSIAEPPPKPAQRSTPAMRQARPVSSPPLLAPTPWAPSAHSPAPSPPPLESGCRRPCQGRSGSVFGRCGHAVRARLRMCAMAWIPERMGLGTLA